MLPSVDTGGTRDAVTLSTNVIQLEKIEVLLLATEIPSVCWLQGTENCTGVYAVTVPLWLALYITTFSSVTVTAMFDPKVASVAYSSERKHKPVAPPPCILECDRSKTRFQDRFRLVNRTQWAGSVARLNDRTTGPIGRHIQYRRQLT